MKKALLLAASLFAATIAHSGTPVPDNKDIPAEAKIVSATLFFSGVQLQNECSAAITGSGKTLIKIKNISSYADEKSVQVSGEGKFTILSVNYKSYTEKPEDTDAYKKLEKESKDIEAKIKEETTWIGILRKREEFFNANMSVAGKDQVISVDQLKALGDMYSKNIETIKFSITERSKKIEDLVEDLKKANEKLNAFKTSQITSGGEIWVLLSTDKALTAKFNISYFTYNAGWYPSYDVRVNKLNEPIAFTYKANIYQNSGIDWKNITIKCSNATPFQQGDMPELQPYYVGYGYSTQQTAYNPSIRQVTGIVKDQQTGEALPFVNVVIKGTNFGTTTDFDGKFKLNIPQNATTLSVSYVGYTPMDRPINDTYMDIALGANTQTLEEVVVMDATEDMKKSMFTFSSKRKVTRGGNWKNTGYLENSAAIPEVNTQMAATSIDFEIKEPYTVKSDGAVMTVDIKEADVTASFEYHTAPKIEASAFLIARIPDWEKYNLLAGEANLYIENTFVGKSTLNIEQMSDTLSISLGRDKNVIVKREKLKETSQKQFLGGNRIVTRSWKISVRSNKNAPVQLYIHDQLPVSENKDITVEKLDISGAKENVEKGNLEWKLDMQPNETKEVTLKYSVKFPKNSGLIVY
jgi:hypothetical protein